MLKPDDAFIIDAVAHPYNHTAENFADEASAAVISDLSYQIGGTGSPQAKYDMPHDVYLTDWSPEDVANVLFRETATDIAVMHTLPLFCYKDGFCSVEKSAEAVRRWPNRFRAYAAVDPLRDDPIAELDRQVELLHPTGVKVYPTSWSGTTVSQWKMNDPKAAFPIYERALEHGIKAVAVHKAVPLGPVVAEDAFNPGDLEGAAGAFPDLAFEIVHGGIAFSEETGWLLARFPNIHVNLEVSNIILERRPRTFSRMLVNLLQVRGMPMMDRLIWATGCMLAHPRATIDAFCRYEIPEDLLQDAGLFGPLEQITDEHKRNVLAYNYARVHGIDVEATKQSIADDEFNRARARSPNRSRGAPSRVGATSRMAGRLPPSRRSSANRSVLHEHQPRSVGRRCGARPDPTGSR
jgi:predicted TIM-barrel fold metal-dependent hydrolase